MKKTTTKKAKREMTTLKEEFSETAKAIDDLNDAINDFGKTILEKLQAINKMVEEYLERKEGTK